MKKFFAIVLAVLAVSASAQNQRKVGEIIEIGDLNYKVTSLDPATAEVTESPFAEGEIEILTEFTDYGIHYTVNKIGPMAFYSGSDENQAITGTLTIPEGITEIGWQAFIGCNRLDSISLPSTLEKIGNSAFYCYSDKPSTLKAVRCAAKLPPECGEMVFGSRFNAKEGVSRDIPLWVPVGTVLAYRAEKQWDYFNLIIDFEGQESSTVDEQHYNPDPDAQAIDNVESNAQSTKRFVNGVLVIERNGELFNAQGTKL